MFFCEYCEIFKITYFEEHLRTSASVNVSNTQGGKYETKSDFNQIVATFWSFRGSPFHRCTTKKAILKNMEKLTGKHLCRSRFLPDLKKDNLTQVFSCEFCQFFTVYLRASPSTNLPKSRFREGHVNSMEFSKVLIRQSYFAHLRCS